jgi:hypothetical protein
MRPRVATSAEPCVGTDVNSGLMEVSSSLLMLRGCVKPLARHIGRSSPLLEVLLDDLRGIVDAEDVEPPRSGVLESVRSVRGHDDDVPWAGLELVAIGSEPRLAAFEDPRLRVGMAVKVRALAGLVVHMEEGDARAVRLTLEPDRPSRARE